MEMKMKVSLLMIVLVASVLLCRGKADTEEAVPDTKNPVLPKPNGNHDRVNETVEPVKRGEDNGLDKDDSAKQLEAKGGETGKNKAVVDAKKDELENNKEVNSDSKKEPKEGRQPPVREKCDSSSNSCTDDDKTLVACLRVPGNESPTLSLLIQNKGKDTLSISISASDLVQVEKKKFALEENKDTEVKVSINGVEHDHFIILTAGHGDCKLDFKDQVDYTSDSSYFSIFKLPSPMGFLSLAFLLVAAASVFMCTKLGLKYFVKKNPKYQSLDMVELPVSHSSKHESGGNEDWDDSWGDSWDDEEAPKISSLPTNPSVSSKGIVVASRKFSKEGWKD